MVSAKLSRVNFGSQQVPLWQQLHHGASVTTSDGDVLVLDLVKLSLLSPFFRSLIDEFSIPPSLKHLLDVNIILPDFSSDIIGFLVEILEGMVADVTDTQVKSIKDLHKVLGLKIGLLKDGEKINSVKSARPKSCEEGSKSDQIQKGRGQPVSASQPTSGTFSRTKVAPKWKDSTESRTVKFRSEEHKSRGQRNQKKKANMKGGLRERASLKMIKRNVNEERRHRDHVVMQSVNRLRFSPCDNQEGDDSIEPRQGWSSRGEGRVDERFVREVEEDELKMIHSNMNHGEQILHQQQVLGGERHNYVGASDANMISDFSGERFSNQELESPKEYESEQVYFTNSNVYGGGHMAMGREGVDYNRRMVEFENIVRMNTGKEYVGSERVGGGGDVYRGENRQDYDCRQEYEGRRQLGVGEHSYRRGSEEDGSQDDLYSRQNKEGFKPRGRNISHKEEEYNFSGRIKGEEDRFRDRSSSNSKFDDQANQRGPTRDYSR